MNRAITTYNIPANRHITIYLTFILVNFVGFAIHVFSNFVSINFNIFFFFLYFHSVMSLFLCFNHRNRDLILHVSSTLPAVPTPDLFPLL